MAIPTYGIVNGKVVISGGGVEFEAPISNAPSAESPTITVGGQRHISRGGGGGSGGGRSRPSGPSAAEVAAKAAAAEKAAADKKAAQDAAHAAAQARIADIQAKRTAADISQTKFDIQKRGGTSTTRTAEQVN